MDAGLFILTYTVMNLIGFFQMMIDKKRAIHHKWRIPERQLWVTAILGGALGLTIGMYVFRHKTKRLSFKWGFTALMIPYLILVYVIFI